MIPAFSAPMLAWSGPRWSVVEPDGHNRGEQRAHDVRGVEPAAHAHLDDGDVDPLVREVLERSRDRELEPGERHGLPAPRLQALGRPHPGVPGVPDAREHRVELGVRDGRAVVTLLDSDALVDVLEVRRRGDADLVALGRQDGADHSADAAFAVGAADVDDRVLVLRVPDAGEEAPHALEAHLDAGHGERIEDRVGLHEGQPGCRRRGASRAAGSTPGGASRASRGAGSGARSGRRARARAGTRWSGSRAGALGGWSPG